MIGAVTVGFIGGFVEEYMTGGGVSRGTVAGFLAVLLGAIIVELSRQS